MATEGGLDDRVRRALGPGHRVAVAALVRDGVASVVTLGTTQDADLEIGSVSKGLTGLLYADALARGEVTPSTRLGDHLPALDGAPVADVTLRALATHRSGLPRLPAGSASVRRTWDLWRHGANPYGETLADLLEQARRTPVGRPRFAYSNLGFELLGHAVAAGAGTSYAELLDARLTRPLGLPALYAPATPADLRPQALEGRSRSGRPMAPWTGEALAPAGGVRASAPSLARLLQALLDGSSPGMAALEPVERIRGAASIGAAWVVLPHDGRTITWHDGGTGGFRAWLGLDRAAGTGVALVSATARSVDRAGMELLREAAEAPDA